MKTPPLIADPDKVTPEWLTLVLRHAGYDVDVKSVNARQIGKIRFDKSEHSIAIIFLAFVLASRRHNV